MAPGTLMTASLARGARHVLVVEDDSPVRVMVADLLHDAGYGVLQAADGSEALQVLHQTRPDLIVLDLMLPGMSGWQFLEESREELDRARIPVIVLSAITGRGDYPATLGVAAWLTKPLDIDRFMGAVEDLAGEPRSGTRGSEADTSPSTAPVLVIEDEPAIRDLVADYLATHGRAFLTAASISEAAPLIAAARPALIVLDLMLPGRSGWDFLRERQADAQLSSIPVVVISAAPLQQLLEAKRLGASAFLSKPFDLDVLSALLQSLAG
jgi:DNA-binding response OmpR family regulator